MSFYEFDDLSTKEQWCCSILRNVEGSREMLRVFIENCDALSSHFKSDDNEEGGVQSAPVSCLKVCCVMM